MNSCKHTISIITVTAILIISHHVLGWLVFHYRTSRYSKLQDTAKTCSPVDTARCSHSPPAVSEGPSSVHGRCCCSGRSMGKADKNRANVEFETCA